MDNKELIDSFTEYLKSNNKTLSTIIAYKKDIEQLAESNKTKNLIDFSPADIRFFLDYLKNNLKITIKTSSRKLNSVRTFYRFLQSLDLVKINPASEITHPKIKNKRPRVLTKNEYLALREVSRENERLFAMVELLLQTGIRISELAKLRAKEVNLNSPKPFITIRGYSSNPERIVPLNLKIANIINKYIISDTTKGNTLFCTKTGRSIEIRNIRSAIDRALLKADVKNACVNDLRNTFIVHQLSNGISITKVAEIVGHKSLATTSKYLSMLEKKYKPSGLEEVAEL